jgi:hypothetical protein
MTFEPGVTGAELAAAVHREAKRRGLRIEDFAAALSCRPTGFLRDLRRAQQPRRATIARIEALLGGRDVPAAPERRNEAPSPPLDLCPPPVDRHPCPRCGTRADIGCRHLWSAAPLHARQLGVTA